jgi:hypothetical protein
MVIKRPQKFAQQMGHAFGCNMMATRAHPLRTLLSIAARVLAILVMVFLVIQLAPGGPVDVWLTDLYWQQVYEGSPPTGPIR